MPMCPVSLVDRLMGSNIRCIDFSNRCPWLHLHTIRDDSWRFRPIDSLSFCFSWKHWWMDDESSFAPVTMTLSPATLGLRLKLWNRGMTKGWTDEGHLTSVITWQIYVEIWLNKVIISLITSFWIWGSSYELCADLDGFANPYRPMGDTGLSIYISPVAGRKSHEFSFSFLVSSSWQLLNSSFIRS